MDLDLPEDLPVPSVLEDEVVHLREAGVRQRLAEPEERGEFRIRIKQLVAAGDDQPPGADALPEAEL